MKTMKPSTRFLSLCADSGRLVLKLGQTRRRAAENAAFARGCKVFDWN